MKIMDISLLLETYQKMSPISRVVFIDTLSQISSYIWSISCTLPNVTWWSVEGNSFVIFTYKNNLWHSEEVKKHFDISNSMQLWALSLMRIEIIDILKEWSVVQKCHLSEEAKEIFKEKYWIWEDLDESFPRDGISWKRTFDPKMLYRDWENVICDWKSVLYSKFNEDEKNALSLYENVSKGFWPDTITEIINLDESYFHYDLLLTDRGNIIKLKDILINDEHKEIIHSVDLKNNLLIINQKGYIFEISRKWDGKGIEFMNLLYAFFSKYNKEFVNLRELIDFVEKKEFVLHKILTIDLSDSRKIKSHIKVFHTTLWKMYWWNPIIFEMKWSIINLRKMNNGLISSSPEVGISK